MKDIRCMHHIIGLESVLRLYSRDKEYARDYIVPAYYFVQATTSIYCIMKLNRLCDALSEVLFHQHELNARRYCTCMEDHVKGDEGDHLN